MKSVLDELKSFVKEIVSLIHWISTLTLIAGLAGTVGSLEETLSYLAREWIIPSLLVNVITAAFMEILKTQFPSVYRLLKKILH